MDCPAINDKSRIYTLILLLLGIATAGLTLLASPQTRALSCDGFSMADADATFIANNRLAGREHRVSPRKTLVINSVESISGSDCDVVMEATVTLQRRIRRDAQGTMRLAGRLVLDNGNMCIVAATVTDLRLSNTLFVGEFFYKLLAGSITDCLAL
jgi:hypothetical protein